MPDKDSFRLSEYLDQLRRDDREREQAEAAHQNVRDSADVPVGSVGGHAVMPGVPGTWGSPSQGLMQIIPPSWGYSPGSQQPEPEPAEAIVPIDVELDRINDELSAVNAELNSAHAERRELREDMLDKADLLDDHTVKIVTLTDALKAAEKRMDKLRDRLYHHEVATKKAVDDLTAFVDEQQNELTGINGLDGDRIDAMATQLTNVAAAVDDHAAKLATIYGKDLGRITAAEERLDALEGVAAAPESLCKVQYRFGIGAWRDYEPDNAGFLSVGSDGRGLMQIRMVRK